MATILPLGLATFRKTEEDNMSNQEAIESLLLNRHLEDVRISSTVCNLCFFPNEGDSGVASELRIYTKVLINESQGDISVSCPTLDQELIDRACNAAALALVAGAKVTKVQLLPSGILLIEFDNGLFLSVMNFSVRRENAWVLQEPDYSENLPRIEVHCSNAGIVDEFQIG